jgi:hypothetical protein
MRFVPTKSVDQLASGAASGSFAPVSQRTAIVNQIAPTSSVGPGDP